MASIATPYGLQPISDNSGLVRNVRIPFGIASGQVGNMFKYQPVKLNPATGQLVPVTNTGGVPDQIFGIFAGVEYTPLGGRPAVSPFWASGTIYDPGLDMFAYIWPAWIPGMKLRVQADGSVPQAALGSQFNLSNVAAGSTFTGLSACTVGAAGVAAGGQGQFALTEFFDTTGIYGAIGDAFTDLVVTIAYPQVGFGSQKSIG